MVLRFPDYANMSLTLFTEFCVRLFYFRRYKHSLLGPLAECEPSSLQLLAELRKSGLVKDWRIHHDTILGKIFYICSLDGISKTTKSSNGFIAAGAGSSISTAIFISLAEFFERQALYDWENKNLHSAMFNGSQMYISPERFLSFSCNQLQDSYFQRSVLDKFTNLYWIQSSELTDKKNYFIPAQTVYLTLTTENKSEPVLGNTSSNGAAADTTYGGACTRALLELIERDAFFIHWLNKIPPPQINISSFDNEDTKRLVAEFEHWNYELIFFDITTDIAIPTLCSVLIDKNNNSIAAVATATNFSFKEALSKVVYDAARWTRLGFIKSLPPFIKSSIDIKTFSDRESYWSRNNSAYDLRWLMGGVTIDAAILIKQYAYLLSFVNESDKLIQLQSIFMQNNYKCYFTDVTTRLANKAGLHIVKAVAPDLVPIYFDERRKPLSSKRLLCAPVLMGRQSMPSNLCDLNEVPHPFI